MTIRDLPHSPAGNHRKHWSLLALIGCYAGLGCNSSTSNPGASLHTVTFPSASTLQWVKQSSIGSPSQFSASLSDFTTNIALSQDGTVTALGRITGTSVVEPPPPQEQEFLASYDSNGNTVDSAALSGPVFAGILTVATSTPDRNYVAASTPSTVQNSPTLLPLNVEKFSSSGATIWSATLPTTDSISQFQPRTIAVDASGNILVGGQTGGKISGQDTVGVFFAKFDGNSGGVLWQADYPSTSLAYVQDFAVGPDGSLYVAAQGVTSFNAAQPSANSSTCNLVKLDGETGKMVWSVPSPAGIRYAGVAVNSSGNGYLIGEFGVNRQIGYLAGFSVQSGTLIWQEQFAKGALLPTNITVDGNGDAVFAGYAPGADFSNPITQKDVFVAKMASDGHPIWYQKFGVGQEGRSVDGAVPNSPYIVTDSQGDIYLAGITNGAFSGSQNPNGQGQPFVAKFLNQ